MRIDEAFDILGIEIAKDKKKIKTAFAKKVRECHPEEDEAGWKNFGPGAAPGGPAGRSRRHNRRDRQAGRSIHQVSGRDSIIPGLWRIPGERVHLDQQRGDPRHPLPLPRHP